MSLESDNAELPEQFMLFAMSYRQQRHLFRKSRLVS